MPLKYLNFENIKKLKFYIKKNIKIGGFFLFYKTKKNPALFFLKFNNRLTVKI